MTYDINRADNSTGVSQKIWPAAHVVWQKLPAAHVVSEKNLAFGAFFPKKIFYSIVSLFLSFFFLWWQIPNLITGPSGWWAPEIIILWCIWFQVSYSVYQFIGGINDSNSNTQWLQQHNSYQTVMKKVSKNKPFVKSNLVRYNTNSHQPKNVRNNGRHHT